MTLFCLCTVVSEAPKEAPKAAKYSSREILTAKTDEEKKTEVLYSHFYLYQAKDVLDRVIKCSHSGIRFLFFQLALRNRLQ